MAHVISEVPTLVQSIVTPFNSSISLDSKKIVEWKCIDGCLATWRESVHKRAQFTLCPECDKHASRKAKVQRVAVKSNAPITAPVSRLSAVVSTSLKIIVTKEDGTQMTSDEYMIEQGIYPPKLGEL